VEQMTGKKKKKINKKKVPQLG